MNGPHLQVTQHFDALESPRNSQLNSFALAPQEDLPSGELSCYRHLLNRTNDPQERADLTDIITILAATEQTDAITRQERPRLTTKESHELMEVAQIVKGLHKLRNSLQNDLLGITTTVPLQPGFNAHLKINLCIDKALAFAQELQAGNMQEAKKTIKEFRVSLPQAYAALYKAKEQIALLTQRYVEAEIFQDTASAASSAAASFHLAAQEEISPEEEESFISSGNNFLQAMSALAEGRKEDASLFEQTAIVFKEAGFSFSDMRLNEDSQQARDARLLSANYHLQQAQALTIGDLDAAKNFRAAAAAACFAAGLFYVATKPEDYHLEKEFSIRKANYHLQKAKLWASQNADAAERLTFEDDQIHDLHQQADRLDLDYTQRLQNSLTTEESLKFSKAQFYITDVLTNLDEASRAKSREERLIKRTIAEYSLLVAEEYALHGETEKTKVLTHSAIDKTIGAGRLFEQATKADSQTAAKLRSQAEDLLKRAHLEVKRLSREDISSGGSCITS